MTGGRVSDTLGTTPEGDVPDAPTTVLTITGFCNDEQYETDGSTGEVIPAVGDNTFALPGYGAMGTCPLDTLTTLFIKLSCFDPRDDGNGIKIFPPVCETGDKSGFPPSPVNDNTTTLFPSGPRTLIAFGNGSPGLRFKTIEVVAPGCFIAICLGACETGLT